MAATVVKHILRLSSKHGFTSSCRRVAVPTRYLSFSRVLNADRFYTDKHEWVSIEKGKGTVGISSYAQEQLGEIVYVETPEVGTVLEPSDVAGCLESVKAASEVFTPVGGTVTEVNTALSEKPDIVNSSPLEKGWLFKLDLAPNTSTDGLMNEEAYKQYVGTLEQSS